MREVPLQETRPLLLPPAWKRSEGSGDERNDHKRCFTQALCPHAEEIQAYRHSRVCGKTGSENFTPGARDLPGRINCTRLTETALKSLT